MTWFTDSPYENKMTQKPGHGRHGDSKPPVPRSPACTDCPYKKGPAPISANLMKTIQNSLLSAFLPAADISAFDGVKNVLLADASVIRQNGKQQHQQRIRLCYSLNENRGPCPGGCRVWDSAEFY